MDKEEKTELALAEEAVERAKAETYSKQPRFSREGATQAIFAAIRRWVKAVDLEAPDYRADSRRRDVWLRNFWLREPHWAFAVSQAIMIDANRRWTFTGGRNQVYRYLNIWHNAENGAGWRHYVKKAAKSFRTTDLGAVTELGRDGRGGPLRALYHVDSARCQLTGNLDTPLKYYPRYGRMQEWEADDFFRIAPSPSDDEAFRDLGYCATSFALELVKLLYAVLMHDQELVFARNPKGFLLFDGISETQFDQAMEAREEELDAKDRAYFGGLMTFFSEGLEQSDIRLIALSQLPAGFTRDIFIDQTLYAYAAILGLDPSEIWPVRFGALGRGTEMEVQHRKATTKGVYDFTLAHQEALQRQLPDTLQFEYEQRDAEGELLDAEVAQEWAKVAATLYEAGQAYGVPLLDRDRALSILAEKIPTVIPPEWTEIEEETSATDVERGALNRMRERALSSPYVQRAVERFPSEPVVRYFWPEGRTVTLWERGGDALGRRVWAVLRQADDDDSEVLWEGDDFTITMEDVDRAVVAGRRRLGPEFAALLEAEELKEVE